MDKFKHLARFITQTVLLVCAHFFDGIFGVNAIHESLEHIIPVFTFSAFDRIAHRNAEAFDFLLHTEHILVTLAARRICDAQEKDVAERVLCTVFFITRPAFVYFGKACKS